MQVKNIIEIKKKKKKLMKGRRKVIQQQLLLLEVNIAKTRRGRGIELKEQKLLKGQKILVDTLPAIGQALWCPLQLSTMAANQGKSKIYFKLFKVKLVLGVNLLISN